MLDRTGGGGSRDFEANLPEIAKLGGQSGELGSQLVEAAQDTAHPSADAVQAFSGWAIADALRGTQSSCERNVEGFGRWMDDMDDRLSAAVRIYRETDEWSADVLHGQGV